MGVRGVDIFALLRQESAWFTTNRSCGRWFQGLKRGRSYQGGLVEATGNLLATADLKG
jgi:hypothetical protein